MIKLFGSIIKDTPVLSGRLRGNWQCSIGSPKTDELQTRSSSEAVGEVTLAAKGIVGDETVFFRNNLPYAHRIEYDGYSSSKAPEGMVRRNVERFREILKNVASNKIGISEDSQ